MVSDGYYCFNTTLKRSGEQQIGASYTNDDKLIQLIDLNKIMVGSKLHFVN